MSSVTRLRLLSRSMLNVSCQKQKQRRVSLTLPESSMESAGQPRPSEASNLLGVPSFCSLDVDEDEGDLVIGIRPRSSPVPRRKSSITDEDEDEDPDPGPPRSGSRRVSFADAKGLSLVEVKKFAKWDVPKLPGYDPPEGEGGDPEEYYILTSTFSLPWTTEELFAKVLQHKVELETIELLPGTTILKGVIRVLNISFNKAVYIRTTLDEWSTHFDLLAEFIPGSSDGGTDCFSFKLTLVPPFGKQGARVDFCLRYETSAGTFWANNNDRNYVLFCHHGNKDDKDKPQRETVNKKSCLKTPSQNFSTAEDASSKQASSQDNISTDESNIGLEADTTKAQQTSDSQAEASEQRQQKLLMENKQNSGRRRRRKAARISKVRDYFAQRDGGEKDTGRDERPAEIKRTTREGIPGEKDAEERSTSECEALRSDYTCSKEQETSDLAALVKGERATQIQDMPLHSADCSAEKQNLREFVAKSEDQDPDMSYACTDNTAAADAETLASQSGSFTFGTVVAPLYRHVSGKLGSESQHTRDEENPVNTGGVKPPSERRQASCFVSPDTGRESNDVHPDVPLNDPSSEEEKTSVTMSDVQQPADNVDNPAEFEKTSDQSFNTSQALLGDTLGRLDREDVSSHTDLLNPQITNDSVHLQGHAWKEDLTLDLPGQTTAKSPQTCSQTVTNNDENHAQSEIQDVVKPSQSVSAHFIDRHAEQQSSRGYTGVEANTDHEPRETVTTSLKEETLLEVTDELNQIDDPVTQSNELEIMDVVMPDIPPETRGETCNIRGEIRIICEVSEAMTKEVTREQQHSRADTSERLTEGDPLEKMDHREMEAAVSNEDDDFYLADINEVKNWEMMVEEEENDVLTNKEERETIDSNGEDTGAVTRDTTEKKEETVKDVVEEMIATEVKNEKVDNAVGLEDKEWIGEKESEETEAPKDAEVIKVENTNGAEDTVVEKTQRPGETELDEKKQFIEIQQANTERTSVQGEERIEEEEKMRINLNSGRAGRQSQTKVNDEYKEEQNSEYTEEMRDDEAAETEIVDADSRMAVEDREDEAGFFKEKSDTTQSKVDGSPSAPVSTVGDRDAREGQRTCIQTGFQSSKDVTQDRAKVDDKNPAFQGDRCTSTKEPEGDLAGHDSTSAESDSDDEVELYMHCLRAAGTSAQAPKDRIKEAALSVSKRPSISRSKPPPAPLPSITESLDEDQHFSSPQKTHEDAKTAAVAAPSASSGQEPIGQNVSWWKNTLSCTNIIKTLLYTTLLAVFLVVAYHFDFLACFGLYLASVVWLCCQGERQPVKNNSNKAATEK